jgi:uncharacterized protein YcbK (DUF882 family)
MKNDKKLTENFMLSEFLESRFFDMQTEKRVIEIYENSESLKYSLQKLANQLQILRNELDVPVSINIAFRPVFYELSKGRDGGSQHTLCKAADITAEGCKPKYVTAKIEELISSGDMLQGGLSAYSTFTHYDIRKTRARW